MSAVDRSPPRLHPSSVRAGYASPAYAATLRGIGEPQRLSAAGSWILRRRIPGTDWSDGAGLYPLTICSEWDGLRADLDAQVDLVSVTMVTDPFGNVDRDLLAALFGVVRPFKEHLVADGTLSGDGFSRSAMRGARQARRMVRVERLADATPYRDEWVRLYREFVLRRGIVGPADLPETALREQLTLPFMRVYRASMAGRTVGLHLWCVDGMFAYGHLGVTTAQGRAAAAAYALYWTALGDFRESGCIVDLGAGSGLHADAADPLFQWKRKWANSTAQVFLCGRVLDADRYSRLAGPCHDAAFFPAYRSPRRTAAAMNNSESLAGRDG